MVTLKQLQLFLALAQCGRLTDAAEKCFLSQPAASLALKKLEESLGVKLFDRVGRNLILNENAKAIRVKAQIVIQGAEEIHNIFKHQNKLTGNLSLGASMTVGNYFLPKKLIEFNQLYSNVDLSLTILNSQQILDKLVNYEIDFGFVEDEVINDLFIKVPLQKDHLVIVAKDQHPLFNKKNVTIEDLFSYSWVLREKGSGTRNVLEKKINEFQLPMNILLELGSNEAVIEAVSNSNALGCVSESVLKTTTKVKKIDQKIIDLSRYFYLLIYKEKYQSEIMKVFLSYIKD
ncbi:LysR substrate-binding domain-containing protein [Thiotrichales bacterium 19X7-9]|nr:LysR substrate-binding domain-containing protein [Thiotrichales bacterium 19X7-9]